jgi:uncharacterized protein YjbJ (UPF0337 family)
MNRQQVKGTLLRARGSLESLLGRLTGNRRQDAKGVAHQVEGTVRHGIGDVQQAVERTPEPAAKVP